MTGHPAEGKDFGEQLKALFPLNWNLVRHAGAESVPHHLEKFWFCLGGTPIYLFAVQVITGIALTFYYIPSPDQAYASVAAITNELRFGWYIRSLHKWSSNLMIATVFLHLLRVYFTGAYRHPRQLNWCIGLALLGISLAFGFTGYSLVYEQLSFWGATVATNLIDAVPLIGPYIARFVRGGPEIGENSLTRFFILHIGILPTVLLVLLGLHITLIRLHGIAELHLEGEEATGEDRHFRFFPEHVTTGLIIGVLLMYLLTILALLFPAGLGAPADPTQTPAHIKPEWYFYFSFRLLKLTSLRLSVLLTMGIAAVAFFWPFIEGWLRRRFHMPDGISVLIGVLVFLGFLILTVWESLAV